MDYILLMYTWSLTWTTYCWCTHVIHLHAYTHGGPWFCGLIWRLRNRVVCTDFDWRDLVLGFTDFAVCHCLLRRHEQTDHRVCTCVALRYSVFTVIWRIKSRVVCTDFDSGEISRCSLALMLLLCASFWHRHKQTNHGVFMLCLGALVHLKRFRHEFFSSKINTYISFPLHGLDMKPYLHKGSCLSNPHLYFLWNSRPAPMHNLETLFFQNTSQNPPVQKSFFSM